MYIHTGRNSPLSAWPKRNAPEKSGLLKKLSPRATLTASTLSLPSVFTYGVRSTMNGVKPTTCVASGLIRLLPGMKLPLMNTRAPICAPSNSTNTLRVAYDASSVKCFRYQRMLPVS